jgi:hypothetical protein
MRVFLTQHYREKHNAIIYHMVQEASAAEILRVEREDGERSGKGRW